MLKPTVALVGRLLLSLVLLATIAGEIAFTWLGWTGEHVFNPHWHPHARFHAAQMVGVVVATSLAGLWWTWRPGGARPTSAVVVAVVGGCYWVGEFFALVIPGTSASPDLTRPNTVRLLGVDVHGNLLFAGLMIVLCLLGTVLVRRGRCVDEPGRDRGRAHPGAVAR